MKNGRVLFLFSFLLLLLLPLSIFYTSVLYSFGCRTFQVNTFRDIFTVSDKCLKAHDVFKLGDRNGISIDCHEYFIWNTETI